MTHGLIDTAEMYLRTLFELEEEGIVPLRARLVERLAQTPPTVSQTVARLERDGLLRVGGDRYVEFTPAGREVAVRVMRKHRLAECLLVQVIGLDLPLVHAEACRWEHVIGEEVERQLITILGHPTHSPFGNPIPGLDELGEPAEGAGEAVVALTDVVDRVSTVVVRRIAEPLQTDPELLTGLARAGVRPGGAVDVIRSPGGVTVSSGGESLELSEADACHVLVARI